MVYICIHPQIKHKHKQIKRFPSTLYIREMQTKTTMKYFSSIRWHYFLNYMFISFTFIFCFTGSLLLHVVFSSCREQGLLSNCSGFSLQWFLLWWNTSARCTGFGSCETWLSSHDLQALERAGFSSGDFQALKHGLGSCDTWA